jgi:Endoplasmic Reticulum-Golgi Intermediate Compartment (ERGIC)
MGVIWNGPRVRMSSSLEHTLVCHLNDRVPAVGRCSSHTPFEMADEKSILEQLDQLGPPLKQFDAFPKLPASYKARSRGGGVLTIFVILLSIVLVLNDVAEYIWGWTDYEFSVDRDRASLLDVNVDLVVAMPCQCALPVPS